MSRRSRLKRVSISLGAEGSQPNSRAVSWRGTRHLLDCWGQVSHRLRTAKRVALFLDFDGTLAPLRRRPENVWLDDFTRHVLCRLAWHRRLTVWVISGRRLADLRKRVRVRGIRYVGLHGWERTPGASYPVATRNLLRRARQLLQKHLGNRSSIWIEDKGMSFVVHYRNTPASAVRRAREVLRRTLAGVAPRLYVLKAEKSWEVLPREVKGKGATVQALLASLPSPALPIYVGDDSTDESAFAALRHGLTVHIGLPRRTQAHLHLRSQGEVRHFLERLEAAIA